LRAGLEGVTGVTGVTGPTDDDPAADLLREARAAGEPAFGRLLGRYANYLTLLARVEVGRRMQGKLDPADLVQETFLEAHRHFAAFRGTTEREFARWLRRILAGVLANTVRHYFGTRARDPRLEQALRAAVDQSSYALVSQLPDCGPSPSETAARREQAVLFADALAGLPDDYREVLVLRNLEGLPFQEVARRMGRTVDSVEKLWLRAIDRLRRAVEGG
jgi:RNA polymerase sigma-70 factor (ECF subfamily)